MSARVGNWCQTFTGRQFWPLDPRAAEVDIADIAHSLSLQCRFAGHCRRFYSVAQHSVLVSRIVPREFALEGLLHDAAEAYVTDIPRPLKMLSAYHPIRLIEADVTEVIASAFRLRWTRECAAAVKRADNVMLATEAELLMVWPPPSDWELPEPATSDEAIRGCVENPLDPVGAQTSFVLRLRELEAGTP